MQDRYAGDIGDYGKIGLLKCLQHHGFTIGVNWYRVPILDVEKNADGSFKQEDGRYLIPDGIAGCDPSLANVLTKIAKQKKRSVLEIEKADLLTDAVFYNKYLTVEGRDKWHKQALKALKDVDLVFLDPDNGLLVKSVGKQSARSVKYTFYEEVKDYLDSGKSVLIYNHRSRKQENDYFDGIDELLQEKVKVYRFVIQKITFPKGTVRDYFAIPACEEHYKKICAAFADMKKSKWGQLGVCRLYPEWADEMHLSYETYDDHMFIDIESERFNENSTFEDYKKDIIRYLMLCGYHYSEKGANELVNQYIKDIKKAFSHKETVADLATDIGYGCG